MTGRIEKIQREYEIGIRWRAFPLHPETPEEGRRLEEIFANYPAVNVQKMLAHVRNTAAELKLPFGEREKTYNSRLAQELGKWAEEKGRGGPFHRAVFNAYFAEAKNIAKIPVLVGLAGSVGLHRDEAGAVLTSRSYRDAVDADWSLSASKGITAVPTFVLNRHKLVGAQSYETLERLMEVNGVRKKSEME